MILALLKIDGQKVLFYSLGRNNLPKSVIKQTIPEGTFDEIYFGNVYNYFLGHKENSFEPNYEKLEKISVASADVLKQLERPLVLEIETSPYGEQFDKYSEKDMEQFEKWKNEIETSFSLPRLKKVYPIDLEIKNLRMEMYKRWG